MEQGQTVVILQWYSVFIAQKRIHFKTQKNPSFPGFVFSATRNPGFKILPRIGNTTDNAGQVFWSLSNAGVLKPFKYVAQWINKQRIRGQFHFSNVTTVVHAQRRNKNNF